MPPANWVHALHVAKRNDHQSKMKKVSLILGIALAALIVVVGYQSGHKNDSSAAKASSTGHAKSRERLESDVSGSHEKSPVSAVTRRTTDPKREAEEVKVLRRELETVKAQLEKISRPLGQDVLSSTVNCEIIPGETLLTGGYMTADGNYELTFLTPRSVTLKDGSEGFEVKCIIFSVGSDFVEAHGLEKFATNAKNTLQHGEAWKQDEVIKTFQAASKTDGAGVLSTPTVTGRASTPFTLSFGGAGVAQFTIEATVARSSNGNFAIQSRVERTPKAEP